MEAEQSAEMVRGRDSCRASETAGGGGGAIRLKLDMQAPITATPRSTATLTVALPLTLTFTLDLGLALTPHPRPYLSPCPNCHPRPNLHLQPHLHTPHLTLIFTQIRSIAPSRLRLLRGGVASARRPRQCYHAATTAELTLLTPRTFCSHYLSAALGERTADRCAVCGTRYARRRRRAAAGARRRQHEGASLSDAVLSGLGARRLTCTSGWHSAQRWQPDLPGNALATFCGAYGAASRVHACGSHLSLEMALLDSKMAEICRCAGQ